MFRAKYGDVSHIADKSDGECHLCGEPAPLHTYGRCDIYGGRAASIDHLVPQYFGGSHSPDNLMWAHQSCNSYRGIRDVEEVRMELRGETFAMETRASINTGAWVFAGGVGGLAVGASLGYLWEGRPQTNEEQHRANERAIVGAVAGGIVGALLTAFFAR